MTRLPVRFLCLIGMMLSLQGCAVSPDMMFWRGQDAKNTDVVREDVQLIQAAFASYKLHEVVLPELKPSFLMPFINYEKIEQYAKVDAIGPVGTQADCSGEMMCYLLRNGSMFYFDKEMRMEGDKTPHAILLNIDPDGKATKVFSRDQGSGESRAVQLVLYADGKLVSRGHALAGTMTSKGPIKADPSLDPSWFSLSGAP